MTTTKTAPSASLDIILDDNFAIQSDNYNFTLMARGVVGEGSKKAGEERRSAIGYFSRLEHALDAYAQKALKVGPVRDITALLIEVRRVDQAVQKAGLAFLERFPPNYARSVK